MAKIRLSLCICGGQRALSHYCSCWDSIWLPAQPAFMSYRPCKAAKCAPFLFSIWCGMSSAATHSALTGPNPGLEPQAVAFKPGLPPSTWLVRIGETATAKVMASSGQSPLHGSFSPRWLSHKSNQSLPRLVFPSLSGLSCISQSATTVPNTQLGIFQVKMVLLICQTRQYFSLWHMHWKRFRAGAVALPMAVQCWTLVSSPPTIYSWDSICLFCILNIWQHFRHLWPPPEDYSVYSDLRKTQGVSGDLQRHKNLFNENLGTCFRQTSSPRIYNMRSREVPDYTNRVSPTGHMLCCVLDNNTKQ